jgi:hypothetical protein
MLSSISIKGFKSPFSDFNLNDLKNINYFATLEEVLASIKKAGLKAEFMKSHNSSLMFGVSLEV